MLNTMVIETVWWFNFIGLWCQLIGVSIGAYTVSQIRYRQGNFDSNNFDSRNFAIVDDTSNLPRHPRTNRPIPPLEYNRITAALSVSLIIIGIVFHIISLLSSYSNG